MTQSPAPPTWLITGAQGFLGANLGHFLKGRANRIGVARGEARSFQYNEFISLDLSRLDGIHDAVRLARPEVIVHAAALSSHEACESDPELAQRMNTEATERLAQAAEEVGARFILISTDAVFDGQRGNYRESDAVNPFSVYGQTKLEGEQRAADATNALILRTNFFGWSPTGSRSILEFFVNELSAGNQVSGFTDFSVTSMYAQHLAQAIWELAHTDATGIVNVASRDSLSKYEFGTKVADRFNLPSGLITPVASDPNAIPARSRDLSLNTERLASILGSPAPSQEEGIQQAFADSTGLQSLIHSSSDA
jgi:dTDP-4-dehydrorhamnose reductase